MRGDTRCHCRFARLIRVVNILPVYSASLSQFTVILLSRIAVTTFLTLLRMHPIEEDRQATALGSGGCLDPQQANLPMATTCKSCSRAAIAFPRTAQHTGRVQSHRVELRSRGSVHDLDCWEAGEAAVAAGDEQHPTSIVAVAVSAVVAPFCDLV